MAAHNNYEVYQEAKCDLGLVDIVDALDYIKAISVYVPYESKLKDYYDSFVEKQTDMILVKELDSLSDLRRMANVEIDKNGFVVGMVEKPADPKTKLAAYASYIYRQDTIPFIKEYLDDEYIDGALVGGASLKAESFIEMIENIRG